MVQVLLAQIIDNFSYHLLTSQAKAVELGQLVDAQQNAHVVTLPVALALRAEYVEQIGR